MNAFRTTSRILIATAVICVGSVSAKEPEGVEKEIAMLKATLKFVAPVATNKLLKHQNPYFSSVLEGAAATVARKTDMSPSKEDLAFLAANSGARAVTTLIAHNTDLNAKKFEKICDNNLPESVSKVVKYLAPIGLEFVYDSAATSAAEYVKKMGSTS